MGLIIDQLLFLVTVSSWCRIFPWKLANSILQSVQNMVGSLQLDVDVGPELDPSEAWPGS